jgi:hypothetical protein
LNLQLNKFPIFLKRSCFINTRMWVTKFTTNFNVEWVRIPLEKPFIELGIERVLFFQKFLKALFFIWKSNIWYFEQPIQMLKKNF